jgi:hypothetical protein
MNGNNGPSIPPYAFDEEGNLVEVDSSLEAAYSDSSHLEDREGDWSMGYYEDTLRDEFGYRGPLPVGSEILVAGNYLLQMRILWEENIDEALFWIKPITSLTDEEKATALIKSVHDEHNTDDRSRGNKQR